MTAEVKIKRTNIAERMYRETGQGIYRDSTLLGKSIPILDPNLGTGKGLRVSAPHYEYNRIMYRLDLDDPRLRVAR